MIRTGVLECQQVSHLEAQTKRLQLLEEPKKKPPSLNHEALDYLHLEAFSSTVEGVVSRASQDCSICQETFVEGDELTRLLC
jgi:hypothetical protein